MGETSDRVRRRWRRWRRWIAITSNTAILLLMLWFALLGDVHCQSRTDNFEHARVSFTLGQLFNAAVTYYHQPHTDPDGHPLSPRFPESVGPTPPTPACAGGEPAEREVGPADFDAPTWRALNFVPYGPSLYQFAFISSGTGPDAVFTARAIGDLDCDGVFATFERVGRVTTDGRIDGGAGLRQVNDDE